MQGSLDLDRRAFLAAGGALLAASGTRAHARPTQRSRVDAVFEANAAVLPERAGAGANHYPMAAEALEHLGRTEGIADSWIAGAKGYRGPIPRVEPIDDVESAIGDPDRYGDWLDLFRAALVEGDWAAVVARWAPRLAPGLTAGAFHGLVRAGHAARALGRVDTPHRRAELATALAYWASAYIEIPTREDAERNPLDRVEHPWLDETEDVDFFGVTERLVRRPVAPPLREIDPSHARAQLDALVREAAAGFLEMLVQERHRIWMLHTVTAPAAVDLLLRAVADDDAAILVAHADRAVVAMFAAYGAPYEPRTHVRATPPTWTKLMDHAASSESVHTIKLFEALERFDRDDDALCRSVAAQWMEWT
ncbi:MAG: hypothetical protein AAF726_12720 [Planctomycetota bacterium]